MTDPRDWRSPEALAYFESCRRADAERNRALTLERSREAARSSSTARRLALEQARWLLEHGLVGDAWSFAELAGKWSSSALERWREYRRLRELPMESWWKGRVVPFPWPNITE